MAGRGWTVRWLCAVAAIGLLGALVVSRQAVAPTAGDQIDQIDGPAHVEQEFDAVRLNPPTTTTTVPPTTPAVTSPLPPGNPGDTKNCSDFATYSQAKAWFDLYYPYYGDVAKLDGNNNLIPCEALPGAP